MKQKKIKHAAGESVPKIEDGKLSPLVAYVNGILKTDRPLLEKVINERIAGLVDASLSQLEVVRERLEEAKANPARLYGYFKNGSNYETREEATAAIANIQAVDASQSAAIAKNTQDIAGKADLSTSSSFTISKDGWTNKRQTITLAVGKRNAAVGLDSSATDEQCKESADCNVRLYSSNETSITLSCDTVPSLDLPGACILI